MFNLMSICEIVCSVFREYMSFQVKNGAVLAHYQEPYQLNKHISMKANYQCHADHLH